MSKDLVTRASQAAKSMQLEEIHKIKDAWDEFDLNKDGTVSMQEVHNFLGKLNIVIPESEKKRIESQLDRNGNGTIEFIEFVKSYEKGLFKNLNLF